jgi:hypothetical protein
MTNWTTLPHETLAAYQVACELLVAVKKAEIADLKLRDQALRSAKSVCLNIAEATGRTGRIRSGSLSLLAAKLLRPSPRGTSQDSAAIAMRIALALALRWAAESTRS